MIIDPEGVRFLQWCLNKLGLRWPGFRKVRRQVYKRLNRRMQELGLPGIAAYRDYLENHPAEWSTLDTLCWISISRFYRDPGVFRYLEQAVFPRLAETAQARGKTTLCCWCAACSAGEEPYTIAILWRQVFATQFPSLALQIVATDIDPRAIRRAERGCYPASSLKHLPAAWRQQALLASGEDFCVKAEFRRAVTFRVEDIRARMPEGPYDLILCRNLVFTYFDEMLQREMLPRLAGRLVPGGALIIGKLESLPEGAWEIEPWSRALGIYRRIAG